MATLIEFHNEWLNDIRLNASAENDFTSSSFVNMSVDKLIEAQEFLDLQVLHYEGTGSRGKKIALQGYGFDESDSTLVLLVAEYSDENYVKTVSFVEASKIIGKAKNFLHEIVIKNLGVNLEESDPASRAYRDISSYWSNAESVRIYLVLDGKLSERTTSAPRESIDGRPVELQIWDLQRFYELASSATGRDRVVIPINKYLESDLPCLVVEENDALTTFLFAIRGDVLAKIFETWGGRLLEGNVRSFLTFKTKINKSLRLTLLNEPSKFLSFNNGITATADRVAVTHKGENVVITEIEGLQIVNGGQTTASLFHFYKTEKTLIENLKNVFVQVKLLQVPPEISDEMVPLIARFANSQNKVTEADFFANSPFHRRIEEISRREPAPPKNGALYQTYWFYERARGAYNYEKSQNGTEWIRKFPSDQKMSKTDFAKYFMAWEQFPYFVSQGAQKNFVQFAGYISKIWEEKPDSINKVFFRETVAKLLFFQKCHIVIRKSDWYAGGYLANIAAYTVAKLAYEINKTGKVMDFNSIWAKQEVMAEILPAIERVAPSVSKILLDSARMGNISEYAKSKVCWEEVKKIGFDFTAAEMKVLLDPATQKADLIEAVKDQQLVSGIEIQTKVVELGIPNWEYLLASESAYPLSEKEKSILGLVVAGKIPTEAQSKVLWDALQRVIDNGFRIV